MIWAIVTLLVVALFYVTQTTLWNKKKLPPGPIGFPIFGSLHLLGKLPHHNLQKLALKYGPIMRIQLGLKTTIVASSPQAAELFLKTHDHVFASRPPLMAAKHLNWDKKNMVLAPFGSYWRDTRKMCTVELLSSAKISSFAAMRREETGLMIEFVREAAMVGDVVDLSAKVSSLTADMTCRMVFGKKYSNEEFGAGRGFKAVIQEALRLAGTPNLGDYIPFIASFDLQGIAKQMKELSKVFDEFFEKIINEHIRSWDEHEKTKDFVDFMLSFMGSQQSEYRIERSNVKAIMLDMLIASMDTSATTIEWTMSELVKDPRVLKNLQEELQNVVGMERMVGESDLENLDYLDMVVKETFRLHPVVPLLLHAALEDCTVDGFKIPHKSLILINTFAIGRDPNYWTDPENFVPERFIGSNVDVRGRDFQLLPFGSGRRGCPGLNLGLIVVKLVVAQLVHCFDWKLPNGMKPFALDMEEEFGVATSRANHLVVVPTYRLKN